MKVSYSFLTLKYIMKMFLNEYFMILNQFLLLKHYLSCGGRQVRGKQCYLIRLDWILCEWHTVNQTIFITRGLIIYIMTIKSPPKPDHVSDCEKVIKTYAKWLFRNVDIVCAINDNMVLKRFYWQFNYILATFVNPNISKLELTLF